MYELCVIFKTPSRDLFRSVILDAQCASRMWNTAPIPRRIKRSETRASLWIEVSRTNVDASPESGAAWVLGAAQPRA
jgi:hypothetical protein